MGNTTNAKLKLVLMAGLPGAGKTTLSIKLSQELGWYVINKDCLKISLLNMGLDDLLAGNAAYRQSFDIALDILTNHRNSVILDSAALHSFILEEAQAIIRRVENVQFKIVFCVADRDVRNLRLRTRPAQITAIRVDPETIADYFKEFKHLPPEPERLTLFTNRHISECLDEARAYLLQ